MDGQLFLMGLGGLVSVLLSISAYLLHYLVQDIREMKGDLAELKTDCTWLKADNKAMHTLLRAQLSFLRARKSQDRQNGRP